MMALAGGLAAAHIGDDDIVADGLGFASKRRTYLRGPGHGPMSAELLVSIHINDVRFLDGGQAATSAATPIKRHGAKNLRDLLVALVAATSFPQALRGLRIGTVLVLRYEA